MDFTQYVNVSPPVSPSPQNEARSELLFSQILDRQFKASTGLTAIACRWRRCGGRAANAWRHHSDELLISMIVLCWLCYAGPDRRAHDGHD